MRRQEDPRKQDLSPTELDLGAVTFIVPRHFGFCYGVENAIEISYRALDENPDKRVFLLSQMIHNPVVNDDLQQRGIEFIMDTQGNQFIDFDELKSDDVVIIPAFGTTVEIQEILERKGIKTESYNTTCPFVEKVWKRSTKLGGEDYTVIIHGKFRHEETRATFSHSQQNAKSVIVRDMEEATILGDIILGKRPLEDFRVYFGEKCSEGFNPEKDLDRVGVVNQTTMLASETQGIADYFKSVVIQKFGEENHRNHFANTRDTLCYATNDNQEATHHLLDTNADLALVVGGYNSSNTSHIVELCKSKFPTYFINSPKEILNRNRIRHFDYPNKQFHETEGFLDHPKPLRIILTSGASCPDTLVDAVMMRILGFFDDVRDPEEVIGALA